ncbi:MAG: MFS transporter [Lewinellaceae bacterium]|nr:MFS transporter [Lewinellaceae bacterium]
MIRTLKAFALHLPSLSVGLTFMTLSVLFGSWLARLPEVQAALALSEGQLGLALLGLPLGALALTPFAGWLMNRIHTGRAMALSTLLFCASLPFPSFAQSQFALMGSLFVVGLANNFMNISMNAAASAVEGQYGITIMSTCHGMFSLGAMIGAGSAGLVAAAGIPLQNHLVAVALLMVGLQILLRPVILALPDSPSEGSSFTLPPRALLGLVFIGFCIMIGEGAVADWSAIYLRNTLLADPFAASLGYAGFSLAMALGRFAGDGIKVRFGAARLIATGSLLGAGGLGMAILAPSPIAAVAGFTLVGLGFSTVVPLLFSSAAKTPGVAPGTGIAAVASSGVVGFLIGPPLIGGIAEHFGLSTGLGIIAFLALVSSFIGRKLKI